MPRCRVHSMTHSSPVFVTKLSALSLQLALLEATIAPLRSSSLDLSFGSHDHLCYLVIIPWGAHNAADITAWKHSNVLYSGSGLKLRTLSPLTPL
ncbi:hypothetical protein K439DRAFT_1642616 [Ramaria rubella]|nr:hypothetical protein K439DRAFT_1642616 [Ramaria rubella]